MFTLVDRKGLRYLRAEMNNPSINATSMIEGIGKVTDGTLDTTVGMREIPRVSRYTVNGKKKYSFVLTTETEKSFLSLVIRHSGPLQKPYSKQRTIKLTV